MTELSQAEAERHNDLYDQAFDLLRGEILIDGETLSARPGFFARRKLRKAIRLFDQVLELNPQNWPAMFGMAKAHHRLGDWDEALKLMLRAHEGDPSVSGFAREAGLIAVDLGLYEESIELMQRAIETRPGDGSLYSNLGLSCMLAGHHGESVEALQRAVELEPEHELSRRLLQVARHVQAGDIPQPRSEAEVAQAARQVAATPASGGG